MPQKYLNMPQNISTCPISCAGVELDGDANTYPAKNEPWLQQSLTSFGQGVRRSDQERLFLWINYVCTGVVSGKKLVFTLDQVTQFLHSFPRNAVAVVLLPNRASDLRSSPKLLRSKSMCSIFSCCFCWCGFPGFGFKLLVFFQFPRKEDGDQEKEELDSDVKKAEGRVRYMLC